MALSDRIGADLRATFLDTDEIAETVTYTPSGGSPVSIPAVLEPDTLVHAEGEDGTILDDRARLFISSAASGGIESPTVDDTVTIAGVVWKVTSIDASDPGSGHTLELRRVTHREKAGPDHRIRR